MKWRDLLAASLLVLVVAVAYAAVNTATERRHVAGIHHAPNGGVNTENERRQVVEMRLAYHRMARVRFNDAGGGGGGTGKKQQMMLMGVGQ